jgi:hypothetical protein
MENNFFVSSCAFYGMNIGEIINLAEGNSFNIEFSGS